MTIAQPLPYYPSTLTTDHVTANTPCGISNGGVIVANQTTDGNNVPLVSKDYGHTYIPLPIPGGYSQCAVVGVTADGTAAGGYASDGAVNHAIIWNLTATPTAAVISNGSFNDITTAGIADDGTTLVATHTPVSGPKRMLLRSAGAWTELANATTYDNFAVAVSGDGSTAVGYEVVSGSGTAIYWTSGTGVSYVTNPLSAPGSVDPADAPALFVASNR